MVKDVGVINTLNLESSVMEPTCRDVGGERDDGTEGITPCCRGKLVYDVVSPGAGGVHVDA